MKEGEEVVQEESKPEETAHPLVAQMEKTSFPELVKSYRGMMTQIEDAQGEISEQLGEMMTYVEFLMAGKIDNIALTVKETFPAYLQAIKIQEQRVKWTLENIKRFTIECIEATGQTSMDGQIYRARIQKNPIKVVIDDLSLIPDMFKKARVNIECVFDPMDKQTHDFFGKLITEVKKIQGYRKGDIMLEHDNEALKETMADVFEPKTKELLKKGTAVPGAHIEQGKHVRFEIGAKPKKQKALK